MVGGYGSMDGKSTNASRYLALKSGQQIIIAIANQQYLRRTSMPCKLCYRQSRKQIGRNRHYVWNAHSHRSLAAPRFVDKYSMSLQPGCRLCSSVSMVTKQKALSITHKAPLRLKHTRGCYVCETELKGSWAWEHSFPYQNSRFF
jgi:hypothetical protein